MGKKKGVRDGSGPFKGSFEQVYGKGAGKRQQRGEPCPKK